MTTSRHCALAAMKVDSVLHWAECYQEVDIGDVSSLLSPGEPHLVPVMASQDKTDRYTVEQVHRMARKMIVTKYILPF